MPSSQDATVAENECRDLVLWKTPNTAISTARRTQYLVNCSDLQRGERYHNFLFPVIKSSIFCPACPVISYDVGCGFSRGHTDGEGVEATWALLNPYVGGKQLATGMAWLRPARATWRAKL
ncbi:hypothetical protein C8R47DRAFT_1211935 [Mycena vitilis]|nr:hypothetical protein C8R47DRAFT_1211918 [Mycena vitilis]KAJ6499640.1 hypothetical protein C8R47DRAFT_1211935 [Mycena vitilis]